MKTGVQSCEVAVWMEFHVVAPIFGPSEWNLLHVTLVTPRILRLIDFLIIPFH